MLQEIEMPDEILFNFCIDMHCYTAECEKQVDNYFYCKTEKGDEVLIRAEDSEYVSGIRIEYKVIKFKGQRLEYQPHASLIMKDVIEIAENYPVHIEYRIIKHKIKPFVVALNEGGHGHTVVDIVSLLKWVNKNLPFTVEDVINGVI